MNAEQLQRIVLEALAKRAYKVEEDSYSMSDEPATAEETHDGVAARKVLEDPKFEVAATLDFQDYLDFKSDCKVRGVHISAHWSRFGQFPNRYRYEITATPWKYNRAVFTAAVILGLVVGQWASHFVRYLL